MTTQCVQLSLFLQVERDIIEKHIEDHKWFRQIADYNQGVADFIQNYGWLMREMYCAHICKERENCAIARQLANDENNHAEPAPAVAS